MDVGTIMMFYFSNEMLKKLAKLMLLIGVSNRNGQIKQMRLAMHQII
jgi:hypothetical protein